VAARLPWLLFFLFGFQVCGLSKRHTKQLPRGTGTETAQNAKHAKINKINTASRIEKLLLVWLNVLLLVDHTNVAAPLQKNFWMLGKTLLCAILVFSSKQPSMAEEAH
jgi:hypothetical protein